MEKQRVYAGITIYNEFWNWWNMMELDGSSCVSVFTQQWGHAPKTIGSACSWNEAQQAGGFGTLLKNKPLPPKSGII